MMKFARHHILLLLAGVLTVFLISCGGSGGGAGDDEATVRYRVEMTEGGAGCLSRIKYRDGEGSLRTASDLSDPDWSKTVYAKDGAALYLRAEIDCGEVTIAIYLNGSLAERKRRTDRATIEGILRIDSEGNATFELVE